MKLIELEEFATQTKDKVEYIRGTALLLRTKGKKADEVADELGVCRGAVFKWERLYTKHGIEGLQRKRPPGRPPEKKSEAKKIIPELMKKDPKFFGFLKGRWVVRDIAKEIEKESGVEISKSHVQRMMDELGLSVQETEA